jgi:hypothetical protein
MSTFWKVLRSPLSPAVMAFLFVGLAMSAIWGICIWADHVVDHFKKLSRAPVSTASFLSAPTVIPVEPSIRYDPPRDNRTYRKYLIQGMIDAVTFFGDTPSTGSENKDKNLYKRYVPDYTTVQYWPSWDNATLQKNYFCGNELSRFTPGEKIKMVLQDSKLSDYNECYALDDAPITFGGKLDPPNK